MHETDPGSSRPIGQCRAFLYAVDSMRGFFLGLVAIGATTVACGGQETTAKPPAAPLVAASRPIPRAEMEPEGLDETQIKSVVEGRNSAVRGCHTIEFAGVGPTAGTLTVDMEVNADGTVASAIVTDSDFDRPGLEDCVVGVTRDLHFPTSDGPTEFTWRFKFRGPT
jgi:hypothetical protein